MSFPYNVFSRIIPHSLSVCNRLLFPPSFVCPLAGLPTVRFGFFSALCSLIEAKKYPVGFPTRHQRRSSQQIRQASAHMLYSIEIPLCENPKSVSQKSAYRILSVSTMHKSTAAEYICGCVLCSVAHCCVDWIWRDNISPDLTWVILSTITLAVCLADMSASPLRSYPA